MPLLAPASSALRAYALRKAIQAVLIRSRPFGSPFQGFAFGKLYLVLSQGLDSRPVLRPSGRWTALAVGRLQLTLVRLAMASKIPAPYSKAIRWMRMNQKIQINLFHEWAMFLDSKLVEMGYILPSQTTSDERCLYYYDIADRIPEATPRDIEKSDIFLFPQEHEAGLKFLEEKIRNGEDIKPHLSRGVERCDNFDGLLVDWGIYHLNLGNKHYVKNPKYVDRTGPLLYARLTSKIAYFLTVDEHGKWSDRNLIKIIHRKLACFYRVVSN